MACAPAEKSNLNSMHLKQDRTQELIRKDVFQNKWKGGSKAKFVVYVRGAMSLVLHPLFFTLQLLNAINQLKKVLHTLERLF